MDKRADYLARRRLGLPTAETKLSLGRHLEGWLASKRRTVRPSTWVGYELNARHWKPLWSVPLAKLTPNDVRRHLDRLGDEGLSPNSVGHALTVLRMALGQAVDDALLARNVAKLAAAPRVAKRELDIWQPLEIRRFLIAAAAPTYPGKSKPGKAPSDLPNTLGPLWRLIAGSGMRLGEALGVRDVDIVGGSLTVCGSVRPIDARLRKPGQARLARVEPKTAQGWRTIALTTTALAAVEAAAAGRKRRNVAGYLFTSARGTPLDPRSVSRQWDAFLGGNELRRITIHDLRHTFASIMLASGASLYDVSVYLGHSSISITADLYGHLVEGRSAEVAAGFERAIGAG